MVTLRKALAGRPQRVVLVVAGGEVLAALTGSDPPPPGALATARMELYCSRCRCGACWAPARW